MPKYYVESGNVQMVVHAKNARGAAIWAVHRVLGRALPFLADEATDHLEPSREVMLGALMKTSERGFGRTDAAMHDTFDVVTEWNRLLIALDKLQSEAPAATAV
jgi:hypothetical protein